MKRIINLIALSVFIFFSCRNKNADIKLKFNPISKLDFALYKDVQITKRNDVYFIEMNSQSYKIKRSFLGGNLNFVGSNGTKKMSKEVETKIEKLIALYDNIDVLSFRVDKVGNVYLSIPWHDRCTYYFLKLMKTNSLDDINKKSYKVYDENWYLDKECSV
ncbi:hypothetical protein [Emticicia sp. TH156]|uniref:hypothetical protein n=1 Tax=Emticicia sp. TH156 TaxID=2067454 RepID=UPI000C769821|nr:hypothetical protein [Emticicia sp. TH156]PLK42065.1 hypothetical protein C0V77_22855 [Emticicia sp. TH156]